MTEQAAEGGRIPVPADDPGVLAAMVVGSAVNDIRKAVAERVGLTGDEPMNVVLARLDQALSERSYAGPPEGSELVDSPTLAQLREEAEAGRNIQHRAMVAEAIRVGKIPPASRNSWLILLDN